MNRQTKITYCLILFLVFLNIAFRYPTMQHEMQPDTNTIHTLANTIVQNGYAKWVLHPLSYFGLYALSTPSGIPFTLAGMSMSSSVPVELCILLLGILSGIFAVVSAFLAAREIKNNLLFCFTIAFFFSTTPFFISQTTWVGGTRGFVPALIPFFILLLFRHLNTQDVKYLLLAIVYLVVLFTIHRAALLTVFIFMAYLVTIPLHNILKRGSPIVLKYREFFGYIFFFFVVILFVSIFLVQFLRPDIFGGVQPGEAWGKSKLLSGTSFPILILNIGISFTGKIGPLLLLFLIGTFALAWQRRKEAEEKFMLLTMLFTMPFLSMRAYMSDFMTPILILMMGIGFFYLFNLLKKRKKKAVVALIAICLIVPVGYSVAMRDHWRTNYPDASMSEQTYATAIYLKHKTNSTLIVNDPLAAGRISAVSGIPSLPLGGYSKHTVSPLQLTYGYITKEVLDVRLIEMSELSSEIDWIYTPENAPSAFALWAYTLMRGDCDSVDYLLDEYHIHYAVALTGYKQGNIVYFQEWLIVDSELMSSANMKRYMVMQNSEVIVWYLQ